MGAGTLAGVITGFGDELMLTGQARVLQRSDPRKIIVMFEKGRLWRDAWDNNPRIARPDEEGDFQELWARRDYLRPYMQAKTAQQWTWQAYGPERGELYFSDREREFGERYAGRIIFEPNIKAGASPNKAWGINRWRKLGALVAAAGIEIAQLGPQNGTLFILRGAEFIATASMRLAAAVLSKARAVVCQEGGLMHVAAAVGVPAVVIFGAFISPLVTGYKEHINFFTGNALGCGMRQACECCKQAMQRILPEEVMRALLTVLDSSEQRTHREF